MKKRVLSLITAFSIILSILSLNLTTYAAVSYSDWTNVDISSYQKFRDSVLGNYYNTDGDHGAQCWDGANILWRQAIGRKLQTGTGYARGCWESKRDANAGTEFELITDIGSVRRGDIVVFNGPDAKTGHIAFADEDYNGSGSLSVLGQNQTSRSKVTSYDSDGGCWEGPFTVTPWNTAYFLGAFRYKGWKNTIPIQTGFYYIKSALNENYAIDVENSSTENHANIQLSVYDKNSRSQMFFIEKISGEETYKIINLNSNKSFDITDYGEEPGTNLQQSEWANWINTAQRWDFYNAGGGYVYIQSHYHKNCIDVQNGGAIANNNIQLWTPNQTAAQKFKLCLIPPVVNISSNKVNVGETVTVTWEEPYGTQYYDSYLTEFPEGYAYQTNKWHHTGWVAGKYEFSDLPAGHYTFFMHAKNDYAISDQSNWVSFDVYEPKYIPTKTEIYNGHKYILYDYEASWDFCKSLCEEWGGHLVTVNSSDEQEFIKTFINNGSKDAYWLGLTYYYTDTWHWITDEAYDYTNWCSSEPSLSGSYGNKEMFAEIRKSYSYGWNDVSNTNCSNKGFILEFDSITPTIELDVTDNNPYSVINATIENAEIGSQIIFAIYKDNKLIDLQTKTYEGENVLAETSVDYDRIKAMLWENMHGMKPLCPPDEYVKEIKK